MVIIDTSVWIAFLYDKDSQHQLALDLLYSIKEPIGVPEYIAGETITVLQRVATKTKVGVFIKSLKQLSKGIVFLPSTLEFFNQTVTEYTKLSTSALSFIDVSLLVWGRAHRVVTFDKQLHKYLLKYDPLENSPS
jgi:predicted nucleic acid-binding protein